MCLSQTVIIHCLVIRNQKINGEQFSGIDEYLSKLQLIFWTTSFEMHFQTVENVTQYTSSQQEG